MTRDPTCVCCCRPKSEHVRKQCPETTYFIENVSPQILSAPAEMEREKLQQTWDLMSSLPPLIFSESEADHLIATIWSLTPNATQTLPWEGGSKLDWRKIAKAAGKHGVRYRTNTALERFLSEIDATQTREAEGKTYAVDDQGRFCRHCGRASWLHYRVNGVGNLCENPQAAADFRSALIDSLSAELDGSYDCGRVWSAWSYGTMGEDDFSPSTDRVEKIADGIIDALNTRGGA
jgi:hypothetical protein